MSDDITSAARHEARPPDDLKAINETLQVLARTQAQITQLLQQSLAGAATARDQGPTAGPPPPVLTQINIWEPGDDPFSEAVPTANPPNAQTMRVFTPRNNNPRLQTTIVDVGLHPPAGLYNPGTPNFRYWVTQEAVTRGINFWTSLLPAGTTWSTSNPMRITLVAGTALNANYSRGAGLRFYHQMVLNRDIFSCESPDVACHELGHAVLDALKPQLFNAAFTEAGAFHESFGDMAAILCALQLVALRRKVLTETAGHLERNSRLSRLAEQLGWAIRQSRPTAVDSDCLRNAANRFVYRPPNTLPPTAPATQLSSEVHSFSRVFTGAFLDALARMLWTIGGPNEVNLLAVSRDMGQLLVDGVHSAPITSAYFSSVAAAMIQADRVRNGGKYVQDLTYGFVRHGILAVHTALALTEARVPQQTPAASAGAAVHGIAGDAGDGSPLVMAFEGKQDEAYAVSLGQTPELPTVATTLGRNLTVKAHAPETDAGENVFGMTVEPAVFGDTSAAPAPSEDACRSFIEDLIQTGRLDLGAARSSLFVLSGDSGTEAQTTHVLAPDADDPGSLVLKRKHFDCGFCCHSNPVGLECI